MISLSITDVNIFALVFIRVGGMIFFNPFLDRKNVPTQFKIGFALALSLLIIPSVSAEAVSGLEGFTLVLAMIKELFAGLCFGFVCDFYCSVFC